MSSEFPSRPNVELRVSSVVHEEAEADQRQNQPDQFLFEIWKSQNSTFEGGIVAGTNSFGFCLAWIEWHSRPNCWSKFLQLRGTLCKNTNLHMKTKFQTDFFWYICACYVSYVRVFWFIFICWVFLDVANFGSARLGSFCFGRGERVPPWEGFSGRTPLVKCWFEMLTSAKDNSMQKKMHN